MSGSLQDKLNIKFADDYSESDLVAVEPKIQKGGDTILETVKTIQTQERYDPEEDEDLPFPLILRERQGTNFQSYLHSVFK